jgi:hypothetical protein
MKNAKKTSESIRNFDQTISKFSEIELLNIEAMSSVRGGEGDGLIPIIIIPK